METAKPGFAQSKAPESSSKVRFRAQRPQSGTDHNSSPVRSLKEQMAHQRKSTRTSETCIDETIGCPEQLARHQTSSVETLRSLERRTLEGTDPGCQPDCQGGLSLNALGEFSLHYRVADLRAGKTDPYIIMRGGVQIKSMRDL